MGELMQRICREDNLLAAWQSTEANRATEPAPAGEFETFAEHVLDNLVEIGDRLAETSWQPDTIRSTPRRVPHPLSR